jgi:hypothetical protein
MYFDHNLLAITLINGDYAVHSALSQAWLDIRKLADSPKVDVSRDNIYQDHVAPLAIWQAKRCLPEKSKEAERISHWLDGLPESVYFVLMHSSEFESFGGD